MEWLRHLTTVSGWSQGLAASLRAVRRIGRSSRQHVRLRPLSGFARPDALWLREFQLTRLSGSAGSGDSRLQQVYVGQDLPSVADSRLPEPALIDDTLPVARLTLPSDSLTGPTRESVRSYAQTPVLGRGAYLHWLARWFASADDSKAGHTPVPSGTFTVDLTSAWRYFWGLERRLLLEASGVEWGTLVVEVYRLRQSFGHDSGFEDASRALLETAALLRMSQGLHLPLEKLTEAHLLQWDERLLFQGLLPAKRFRMRRQQLVQEGVYHSVNPGMGIISLHAALASGGKLMSDFDLATRTTSLQGIDHLPMLVTG